MTRIEKYPLRGALRIIVGAVVFLPLVGQSPLRAAGKAADVDSGKIMKTEVEKPGMEKAEVRAEQDLNANEVDNEQEMGDETHRGMAKKDRDLERQAKQADREMKEAERDEHAAESSADHKGREIEKEVPEVRDNADRQHGGETGGGSSGGTGGGSNGGGDSSGHGGGNGGTGGGDSGGHGGGNGGGHGGGK